jgi:hypothetical protein
MASSAAAPSKGRAERKRLDFAERVAQRDGGRVTGVGDTARSPIYTPVAVLPLLLPGCLPAIPWPAPFPLPGTMEPPSNGEVHVTGGAVGLASLDAWTTDSHLPIDPERVEPFVDLPIQVDAALGVAEGVDVAVAGAPYPLGSGYAVAVGKRVLEREHARVDITTGLGAVLSQYAYTTAADEGEPVSHAGWYTSWSPSAGVRAAWTPVPELSFPAVVRASYAVVTCNDDCDRVLAAPWLEAGLGVSGRPRRSPISFAVGAVATSSAGWHTWSGNADDLALLALRVAGSVTVHSKPVDLRD